MTYRDLKLGDNGLPTWDALAASVLTFAIQRKEWQVRELKMAVADSLALPEDLRKLTYGSHQKVNVIEDRVGWAISELTTAGLLIRQRRGYYQVSPIGRTIQKSGDLLDQSVIHNQPQYRQHRKELVARKQRATAAGTAATESTVSKSVLALDQLSEQTDAYNAEVATDLLQRIREADPNFFEDLVVKLLVAMGYKGPNGSAWVTQRTNDGGIDGVINQDALGTNTVYVQAKRYSEDNRVQRPVIDSFYGALNRNHADRGVLITTSSFSKSAIAAASEFSIVLIDGIQLTDLMLDYHVGVQVKQQFEFFEIDEDFFDD